MRPGYFHGAVKKLNLNVAKYVSQTTLKKKNARNSMSRPHIVTRYGCLNPTALVTHNTFTKRRSLTSRGAVLNLFQIDSH